MDGACKPCKGGLSIGFDDLGKITSGNDASQGDYFLMYYVTSLQEGQKN